MSEKELRITNPWGTHSMLDTRSFLNITAKCKVFAGSRVLVDENFVFRNRQAIARDVIVAANTIISALQVLLKVQYSLFEKSSFSFGPASMAQGQLLIARTWQLQGGPHLHIIPTPPRDFGCHGSGDWSVKASLPEAHSSTSPWWVLTDLKLVALKGAKGGTGLSVGPVSASIGGSSAATYSESFRFRVNILR